jgi:putative transposase
MGVFEKLMKRMAEYYARERGGIGWKWQAMDSKHSAAPLGGQKTGKNPTDRGKQGAKTNLVVEGRGALSRSYSVGPTATTKSQPSK